MSEERKKVSTEQLGILIEEMEQDRTLLSGRGSSSQSKMDLVAKWEELAKKLNSVENGAIKNVTKWQQSLRDWKNNTKKKATKWPSRKPHGDGSQELTSLEHRLLALYDNEMLVPKPVGIDISSIVEVDPLSSESSCGGELPYPDTFTSYRCNIKNEDSSHPTEHNEDNKFKVKRRRIQMISEDVISQQNSIITRLTALEASRQEAECKQNSVLEAVTAALDRHTAATAELARATDAQAQVLTQILEFLNKNKRA